MTRDTELRNMSDYIVALLKEKYHGLDTQAQKLFGQILEFKFNRIQKILKKTVISRG